MQPLGVRTTIFSTWNNEYEVTRAANVFLDALEPWQQGASTFHLSTCSDGQNEGVYYTVLVTYPIVIQPDDAPASVPTRHREEQE